MSATQDKTQKTTFVYSNLYSIYRKGKEAATNVKLDAAAAVIKTGDHKQAQVFSEAAAPKPEIREYQPISLLNKRVVSRPASLPSAAPMPAESVKPAATSIPSQNSAINGLKQNLKALNDLQGRLRFMLQELEELTKE